ncbi:magnesium-transporting ATPase (P-type) [Nitrobacteraceae bacterium AZCC 2146]
MLPVASAFRAFVWFLWQSSIVGGLGSLFFWVPFLLLVAGLFGAWKISEIERKQLWILLTLPAIWILVGLLGGYYWVDWQHVPMQRSPPWVQFIVGYGIFAFLVVGLATIIYLKGARWFASVYFVINLYFMLTMTFLASMAVTGNWL